MKMRANGKVVLNPFLLLYCILNTDEIMEFRRKSLQRRHFTQLFGQCFHHFSTQNPQTNLFSLGPFLNTGFLKIKWVCRCKPWTRNAQIWEKPNWDPYLRPSLSCRRMPNVRATSRTISNCKLQELSREYPALQW